MLHKIPARPYSVNVFFAIGTTKTELSAAREDGLIKLDDREFETIVSNIKSPLYDGFCTLIESTGNVFVYVDWNSRFDVNVVTHELYHATTTLLSYCGVEHTENDESYAYFNGWLNEQFFKIVNSKLEDTEKRVKKYQIKKDETLSDWCKRVGETLPTESNVVIGAVVDMVSRESYIQGSNDCGTALA